MKKNIIKRVAVVSLACISTVAMFTGCGKSKDKNASARKVIEYDVNDYVKLGSYTGLSTNENTKIVTDEDVQAEIDSLLSKATTYNDITNRNCQTGDTVTIDYVKSQTGKADENKTGVSLELGKGTMSADFENQVTGLATNGTKTFTIKEAVQDNTTGTTTEDANAQKVDVTYKVTLKGIKEKVVPELTDNLIASNSDYKTIDEFKAGKKKELEENNAKTALDAAKSDLLNQVVKVSEVSGCPAFIYNMNYNSLCQSYSQYAGYFSMNLENYLKSAGSSMDELKNQAVAMTKQTLVIEAIAKKENIDITDDQFSEKLQDYVDNYGFKSKDEVLDKYSKEELTFDMRRDVVLDYLYKNATVNKQMVSE